MTATDSMMAKIQAEIEEKRSFQEQLIAGAQKEGRDLKPEELDLYQRASDDMKIKEGQIGPLREGARIAAESFRRTQELQEAFVAARNPAAITGKVEYRSAAVYIADLWAAQMGADDANQRLDLFHRAAAHQTMADNPGLLPESIVGPVVEFVDNSRPVVSTIGTTDLGPGSWSYARVTQHTLVAQQTAEKAELASRKMTITKTPITAPTLGGYVNVSKQDISRSHPQILDMIIADLANEYARETEEAAGADTDRRGDRRSGDPHRGSDRPTDQHGVVDGGSDRLQRCQERRPAHPRRLPRHARPHRPAVRTGQPDQRLLDRVQRRGVRVWGDGCHLRHRRRHVADAAGRHHPRHQHRGGPKMFEMRYGALQVNEPSVWGVQVGYAGDFQTVILEATGVVKITKTP